MSRHKPQSLNSVRESLPVDLLIEIFSRVPAKSIARFRCLSKLWGSILVRSYFTELFLTKSLTRTRFFFTIRMDEKLFFYSSPQPLNLDGINSSVVVDTRYNPYEYGPRDICTPLYGLLFFLKFGNMKVRGVCNPATGDFITLPSMKGEFEHICFGYDPVNKQFKVLCLTSPSENSNQILTLNNTGKLKWRRIECKPHNISLGTEAICIDGVFYYVANVQGSIMMVCFDVMSEKFRFINLDVEMLPESQWKLVNYKGRLAAQMMFRWHDGYWSDFNDKCLGIEDQFVLWVLEDAGNHKWSKHTYIFPPEWNELAENMRIIGMASTGEIVFTPFCLSNPFYVFFYNFESKTFTKVHIQGFEESMCGGRIDTFLDYTENIQGLLRL